MKVVSPIVRVHTDEPAALLYGALRTADNAALAYGADAVRLAEPCGALSSRLGSSGFALVEQGAALNGEDTVDLVLVSITDVLGAQAPAPFCAAQLEEAEPWAHERRGVS